MTLRNIKLSKFPDQKMIKIKNMLNKIQMVYVMLRYLWNLMKLWVNEESQTDITYHHTHKKKKKEKKPPVSWKVNFKIMYLLSFTAIPS